MRGDRNQRRSHLCLAKIGAGSVACRRRAMGRQDAATAGLLARSGYRAAWRRSCRRLCAHRIFPGASCVVAARAGADRRTRAFHRGAQSGAGGMMRAFVIMLVVLGCGRASAQANDSPRLHTHQSYIEDVLHPAALDVKDPLAVFAFVLNSLPDRVKVYPTENYFYFTFELNGAPYAGNIRLDASDRDQGKVQFGYYEQTTGWRDETPTWFEVLDDKKGVKLEKLERFVYRLSYGAKSVVFELNDLSQVKPPATALAPGERFIGPIFDDSGIRFFLVYNPAIKNFLYVLDETVKVADEFFASPSSGRIVVGKRSSFVFYRDDRLDRKILIGVYEENVRVNNY